MITNAHDLLRGDVNCWPGTKAYSVHPGRRISGRQRRPGQNSRTLAGEDRNIFAVGDPDQAIYRFRGASSAAFGLFQHHFADSKLVARKESSVHHGSVAIRLRVDFQKSRESFLENGTNSISTFAAGVCARRSCFSRRKQLPILPVDVVAGAKAVECSDLVRHIRALKRKTRCEWKDFAVLYRIHFHRDDIAAELAEQGIPFSIENMDVIDTSEARDLFACLGAIVSEGDGASLFRVAALPCFTIDAEQLRAGMKAVPREERKSGMASVLAEIHGGPRYWILRDIREEIARGRKTHQAHLQYDPAV